MSVWKFKSLTPTLISKKLTLIRPEDLVDMANKNLDYVYSILKRTPYHSEVSTLTAQELDAAHLETALLKSYMRTCEMVMEHSPKTVRLLVSWYLKKFEVENIKTILRSKIAGVGVEEAMKYITPVGKLDDGNCRRILEKARNVRGVVGLLLDLEYGFVLMDVLREYEKNGDLLLMETAMFEYIYTELWRAAEKLRGLDEKIAKTVLGVELAALDIKVILRSKMMGLNEEQVKRYLVLYSRLFDERRLGEAIREVDVGACIAALKIASRLPMTRDFQYMLNDVKKEYTASRSLTRVERRLDESLLETNLRMLKRYTQYFNIGLVLAFINLKWFEVRNLRAIMKGIEEKVPSDKIKDLLILPGRREADTILLPLSC